LADSKDFDIIVIGAGPAGLQAAISAAEQGASVIVFDKKTTVGAPVRCGEFFPSKEEMLNLLPASRDFAHLFEIPSDAIANTCETIRMFSPSGKCWEFPFTAHVLDRSIFEQRMAKDARKLGVEIRLGHAAHIFENGSKLKVGTDEQDSFQVRAVIAADGFPSVAYNLRELPRDRYSLPENVAVNYQYVMDGLNVESRVTEMYTGTSIAPGGYGWIIPKSSASANVGIGIRTTFKSGRGKDHLDHFVRSYPPTMGKLRLGRIQTMIADVLPVDGALSKTCSDRVLLAGDAAGMVMPTNGGGIPTAMVSGRIAGEVAALHVKRNVPLSTYETRWKMALGRELTASARLRRFADVFMPYDVLYDYSMRLLRTAGIKKVVTCKIPSGLGVLMRLLGY
jgi:digeranylgeranylglycerophospholipid reductase